MHQEHIRNITAVTDVFPDGQRCTGAVIEYDVVMKAGSLTPDDYSVTHRNVTAVTVSDTFEGAEKDGCYVKISLDPEDETAETYVPGSPWEQMPAKVLPAKTEVWQNRDLLSLNGTEIRIESADKNNLQKNHLVDKFQSGTFEGLTYNLFVPENYNPAKTYPLVQFIHDAGVCGPQAVLTLAQGVGALVWMTQEAQKKQECFVLAPQFDCPSIVDDDWNVDERLETEKRLLDKICEEYSIDTNRLYTTGQSMGCMSSMVLNLRYPDLFAASFFVAGQWDEFAFRGAGLEKKKFWFINSMGDAKAFPGMNQILCILEQGGAKIAREIWETGWSQEEYRRHVQEMEKEGADIFYTPYDITTVANGWHSHGGEHHVNTWRTAYGIEAIHEWLFSQHKT